MEFLKIRELEFSDVEELERKLSAFGEKLVSGLLWQGSNSPPAVSFPPLAESSPLVPAPAACFAVRKVFNVFDVVEDSAF